MSGRLDARRRPRSPAEPRCSPRLPGTNGLLLSKSCRSSAPAPAAHGGVRVRLQWDRPSADARHHKGIILNFKGASSADDSN